MNYRVIYQKWQVFCAKILVFKLNSLTIVPIMKKMILFLVLPLLMTSCLDKGSNYTRFTGNINIDKMTLPDSASIGDTIQIAVKGGAPNGCWSELELTMNELNDSLIAFSGIGLFESTDGICTEIYQTVDSSFDFIPKKAGKWQFYAYSANNKSIIDSLVVVANR